MNWLDIVIIIVLVGSVFAGWKNGLIRSVISLIGLVVGIKLAGIYYIDLAGRLSFISGGTAARVVAFLLIFAAVMAVALLLGWILTKVVASLTLGWLNGLGGMVFGLLMGALTVSVLLAVWVRFFGINTAISGSGLASFLVNQLSAFTALLPSEFDVIRNFLN